MKFSALSLLIIAVLASGCSHRNKSIETEQTVEQLPEISVIEDSTLPEQSTEQVDIDNQQSEPAEPVVTIKPDLLTRIRDGFAFPEFHSKHVRQYEKWNSSHPTYLKNLFDRATPYLHHIANEVEKRNMPMEIALLPAVESAFKPNALSRSRAAGLWQFLSSTGRHYGLKQNWWYDGRYDALASTTAALDYLEELHKMFNGDWQLALAAYNAGQGTVLKAIKRNKSRRRPTDFRHLNLRSETSRYVPKLYALCNLIKNPDKFGIILPIIKDEPYFDVIKFDRQIDLHQLANQSNFDFKQLKQLNAGYRRWATPPNGPHRLIVPIDNSNAVTAVLNQLKDQPIHNYRSHKIRQGDTLSGIARKYGVPVSAIRSTNKLNSNSIRAGKSLIIPLRTSPSRQASIARNTASKEVYHRVVAGDTLWSIARRYRVKVGQLASWNKLSVNQVLNLDQVLRVFPN